MIDDIVTRLRDDATAMRNAYAEDRFFAVLGVYAKTNDAAADEIERLRRDGDYLLYALKWAMKGRFVPEDMAYVMDSWEEARHD